MGKDTDIQWCDSTVNPSTGCDGCELWETLGSAGKPPLKACYAGPIHEGRLAKSLPALYGRSFTEVRLAPGRMAKAAAWPDLAGTARPGKPWLDGLPRLIFVGDMGDLLSKAVPFDYLADELIEVALSPKGRRHVWMVLTKRPSRLAAFAAWLDAETGGRDWPENVWAGTSVTGRKTAKRIDALLAVPAAVRFVSLEPLTEFVPLVGRETLNQSAVRNPIRLAIVGGESTQAGHEARPFDIAWARRLIGDCRSVGIDPFIKQLGSHVVAANDGVADWFGACGHLGMDPTERFQGAVGRVRGFRDSHGGDWLEWPEYLRVREIRGEAVSRG